MSVCWFYHATDSPAPTRARLLAIAPKPRWRLHPGRAAAPVQSKIFESRQIAVFKANMCRGGFVLFWHDNLTRLEDLASGRRSCLPKASHTCVRIKPCITPYFMFQYDGIKET